MDQRSEPSSPPQLIYGLGRSGRAVARFLAARGQTAHWHDRQPSPADQALMEQLGFEPARLDQPYQTVIAAPGVPIDHPDLLRLRARGAEVIGEVLLAQRAFPQVPLIGVTGTAGKGGTCVLIAQLLRRLGIAAKEGGNIDPPLLDVIAEAEVAVVELSSFQLERAAGLRLAVAVITNLGVDHLDRHGSLEAYHAAKLKITAGQTAQDVLIVPQDLQVQTQARCRPVHSQQLAFKSGEVLMPLTSLPSSVHPANAAAALLAVEALLERLGRPRDETVDSLLRDALREAQAVPGRFETVARLGKVAFIDDSIATRTISVRSALERAVPPIAWLVGGRDKGAELEPLRQAAQGRVARVIAFGEDGLHFAQALGLPFELVSGPTGDEQMAQAVQAGLRALPDGGTVLLAPIGTSFDAFSDYKARGQSFKGAAQALSQHSALEQT